MIVAAFLTSALALPLLSAPQGMHVESHITFSKFLSMEQRILLVGGDPAWVGVFRSAGLKAFGALTEDQPGATARHAVSDPKDLSFLANQFQALYWLHPNNFGASGLIWLAESTRLLQFGGYLIFNEEHYPDWPVWMVYQSWDRMPFRLGPLVIYKKRSNGHHRQRGSYEQGRRPFLSVDQGRVNRAYRSSRRSAA